jgi:oligosaccharide repeat unit polymerase
MTENVVTPGVHSNSTKAALALAAVVAGLCVLLVAIAPSEHRAPLLHYALIVYLVTRLIKISYAPESAASLLMLHWFTLFGAMIPLLFQYQGDSFYYPFMASAYFDILGPVAIVFLFVLFVDLGHYLASQASVRGRPEQLLLTETPLSLTAVMLLLVVANVLIFGALRHFGFGYLTATRLEQAVEYETDGLGFFLFDVTMRLMLYWCFVLAALVTRDTVAKEGVLHRRALACVAVLMGIALEILIFSNPLSTARFLVLGLLLMMFLTIVDFRLPAIRLGLVAGAAASLYIVFPILGSASRSDEILWVLDREQLTSYLSHLDFDNGAQLLMGYRYSLEKGFYYGLNVLSALLVLVPRSIWPQKSEGVGADVITYFGGTFTNVSAPIYLEFFLDFGFAGVAVFSLALGFLLGWLNQAALRTGRYSVAWMLNIAMFATMPLLVRGALMTGTVALYAHAIAAMTWFGIAKWLAWLHRVPSASSQTAA